MVPEERSKCLSWSISIAREDCEGQNLNPESDYCGRERNTEFDMSWEDGSKDAAATLIWDHLRVGNEF